MKYKLQHHTTVENLIKILESGYISPPKRKGIKSWSPDFVFFRIVPNKEKDFQTGIYIPFNLIKNYPHFIHPTNNMYGLVNNYKNRWKSVKFSENEMANFLEAFSFYDKDNNGLITRLQFNKIRKDLGISPIKIYKDDLIGGKRMDFERFLNIIKMDREKTINCDCLWEYVSPQLEILEQIKDTKRKSIEDRECSIDTMNKTMNKLVLDTDYCDGGNEVGINGIIYIKDFLYIVINKRDLSSISNAKREKLKKLLHLYKKHIGLKWKMMTN
jgi:hypothetical protein